MKEDCKRCQGCGSVPVFLLDDGKVVGVFPCPTCDGEAARTFLRGQGVEPDYGVLGEDTIDG